MFITILFFTSCKTVFVNWYFKTPIVENGTTINRFINKNKFNEEHQYYLTFDTLQSIEKQLFTSLIEGYHLFDSKGNLLCYKGNATCSGLQFKNLLTNQQTDFEICRNDTLSLASVLKQVRTLEDQKISTEDLPKTSYYIVQYWAKFLGGRMGYKENVNWFEEEIHKDELQDKFTVLKVNTDFNEFSGFEVNSKARLKVKVSKDEGGTVILKKLPELKKSK